MTFRLTRGAVLGLAASFCAAALTGCGAPPGVRGTVTLDGAPVTEGSISFEPADGQGPSAGANITGGRFEIPPASGLKPGKMRVTVRAAVKTGKQVPAGPPAPPGTMTDELKIYPPRGTPPEVREVELRAGDNEVALDLSTPKGDKKSSPGGPSAGVGTGPSAGAGAGPK